MGRPAILAALPLLFILLLAHAAGPAKAAKQSDIAALKMVGQQLGLPPGVWNLSSDPCSGNWLGVGCCLSNSSSPCCGDPKIFYKDLSQTFQDCADNREAEAEISLLLFRRDIVRTTLNGTIHDSICNLTLQLVDFGIHNLSGPIPSCLGSVSALRILRLGANSLKGTIPPELGNLNTSLEELYLDNLQLEGEIPPELGKLSALTTLSLRGNKLSGSIPRELGQLPNLTSLELQINRLVGGFLDRLPQNVELVSVYNNRLSGQINASTFLSAAALKSLNLRGNSFSGPIPPLSLPRLESLDLGFNQFNGSLPSFSGCPVLEKLFLGHNQLNGGVNFSGLSSLGYLDLSHNLFTGSLQAIGSATHTDPSFNFFDMTTAPSSLTLGTKQSFFNCEAPGSSPSCVRWRPGKSMLFAVNAAGSRTSPATKQQIRFDADADTTKNFSVGLFYGPQVWAMELSGENAGTYTGKQDIRGNLSSDELALCRTMRWSSSYIAYHGQGLAPGNYVVSLYFAETVFDRPGYRIFDVRVAGTLIKKDLDVLQEAGGANTAYKLISNSTVNTSGTIAVELLFVAPERYLLPERYDVQSTGPMLSAISVVSTDYQPSMSSSSLGAIISIALGCATVAVSLLAAGFSCWYIRRRRKRKLDLALQLQQQQRHRRLTDVESLGLPSETFTYQELYDATNGFNEKLGEGGFGAVYKGVLPNGMTISVKQLVIKQEQHSGAEEEDFKSEIILLGRVRHRNLLSVIGYSLDSEVPMLVTEFMHNGSLDKWLWKPQSSSSSSPLSWDSRRTIAIGVARGLAYLHEESKYRIIHCDVKPANILLDAELKPRIGDFGLATLYTEKESHVTATRLKGTAGYLAPEYAMHLQLSDKVDVYSFGVVLLELLSGRRTVNFSAPSEQCVLVDWSHQLAADTPEELLHTIVDPRLRGHFDEDQARDMATVAILCTQRKPSLRPKMQNVWLMLNGTIKVPEFIADLDALLTPSSSGGSLFLGSSSSSKPKAH